MSKRFRFAFDEDQFGYVYFDAESLEEAQDLLEQVQDYEIELTDLPNAYVRHKGGEVRYENLEEVE